MNCENNGEEVIIFLFFIIIYFKLSDLYLQYFIIFDTDLNFVAISNFKDQAWSFKTPKNQLLLIFWGFKIFNSGIF